MPLTKREAAIVSAYTGYLIGDWDEMHKYAEEKLGRPIFTHTFPVIADELKKAAKADFIAIPIED